MVDAQRHLNKTFKISYMFIEFIYKEMMRSDSVHSLRFFIIYTFRIHLAEKERSMHIILFSIV